MVNKGELFLHIDTARSDGGKFEVSNEFIVVIKDDSGLIAVHLNGSAVQRGGHDD